MTHITAQQLIDEVLDPHTFQSWDETPHYGTISDDYRAAIDRARTKSGVDEAVITGEGMISGTRVAFVLSEFTFLGGSIGAATARRIITAIHRATAEQLPLLISPSSGGTRMQEGTPAFALMVSITTAVYRHKDAHLPFIVYLRNPTTGGVMASWGSAGHITFAEPGALLGFLGPRVVELTTGKTIPAGVQQGEHLAQHGVIDGVISPKQLRAAVQKLAEVLLARVLPGLIGRRVLLGESEGLADELLAFAFLGCVADLGHRGLDRRRGQRRRRVRHAEHAFDPVYAEALGVDMSSLYISQPDNGEQALDIAEQLIRSGAMDLVIIDSVAALVPKAEIEGDMGEAKVGLQARLMSQALRKITGAISKSNTACIFINQLREKIGGNMYGPSETTTGGNALKFYASVRLDIRRRSQIKDGDEVLGNQTTVKVVKNKVAPPFRSATFDIIYGEGISRTGEIIDLAESADIIKKSGAWYSYGATKLGQGREAAKTTLLDNPELMEELTAKINEGLKGNSIAAGKKKKRSKDEDEDDEA